MSRRSVIPGVILIIAGILALLWSLGLAWARMENLWPFVLLILGVASFAKGVYSEQRDRGAIWFGVIGTLSGLVFAYITLGPGEWQDLAWLWPVFPFIGGVGWVVEWIFFRHAIATLALGLAGLLLGVIGFTLKYSALAPQVERQVANLWPLLLVLVGAGLVIQFMVRRE